MSQPYSPPNSAMPEGSSSCRSRAQTTVRSRNSTKPASVSAAAATPALRGIDLRGHHHTWPGPGNRRRRLRDCPCAMSSNEKHEQPGQARHNRGRRISAARTLARDLPPAAPGRPRPRSSPCSDPTPSSGPPPPPTTPATRPSNSSPGWCQPTSPPPRRLVTPQTTPALTDPAAWRPAPMASPARATHTGSPRRPGQATTRIPAGKCAPPPTSPQRRDHPTQGIGN
jgi:hypothetical protein